MVDNIFVSESVRKIQKIEGYQAIAFSMRLPQERNSFWYITTCKIITDNGMITDKTLFIQVYRVDTEKQQLIPEKMPVFMLGVYNPIKHLLSKLLIMLHV